MSPLDVPSKVDPFDTSPEIAPVEAWVTVEPIVPSFDQDQSDSTEPLGVPRRQYKLAPSLRTAEAYAEGAAELTVTGIQLLYATVPAGSVALIRYCWADPAARPVSVNEIAGWFQYSDTAVVVAIGAVVPWRYSL